VALVALLALAPAASSRAGDGAVEINQARALAGGVTPGDSPGFPVRISVSGSYVLTSNLVVTDPNADAIFAPSNGVTIDLNGFEISGPVTCTGVGSAVSCTPAGTGRGINAQGTERVTVRDGRVRGFAEYGVFAQSGAQIRQVTAQSNGGTGVQVGDRSIVSGSIAHQNGNYGIGVNNGSVVERSASSGNRVHGILAAFGSSVVGSAAYQNGDRGIWVEFGCVARDNSAYQNEGDGIGASPGSLVSDNAANENGQDGIEGASGVTVQRNSTRGNGLYGLRLGSDTAYRENTITGNAAGSVDGGVNMGDNSCNGSTTCP
jgi:hypothetical protein